MGSEARRPRVTVLLPCRNEEAFLPACIESLKSQTLEAFEVVAVDDGSTDATRELLDGWARRDARVRVLDGGGRGVAAAAQGAADQARAPLLTRMDGDDVAHAGRLERQVAFLDRRPALAACGVGVEYFPREAVGSGYRRYERWLNGLREPEELVRDLLVECPVAGPTLMLRRSVLRALGGHRDTGWPEDYDLVLRLHLAGMRAANLPDVLHRWRLHDGNISRSDPAFSPDAFLRCKSHFLAAGFLPEERPPVMWGAGEVGKPLARALEGQGRPVAAFVDLDPRKIGQRIAGAPVMSPDEFGQRFPEPGGPGDAYVLGAVGAPGARGEIRSALETSGRVELRDFRMVA